MRGSPPVEAREKSAFRKLANLSRDYSDSRRIAFLVEVGCKIIKSQRPREKRKQPAKSDEYEDDDDRCSISCWLLVIGGNDGDGGHIMAEEELMVVLRKSEDATFGFSLLRTDGFPHVIYDIVENSPAAECGEVSGRVDVFFSLLFAFT